MTGVALSAPQASLNLGRTLKLTATVSPANAADKTLTWKTDNEKVAWYDENLRDVYDQAFELAVHKEVRRGIVEEGVRPDGRKLDEVRPLSSQVGI